VPLPKALARFNRVATNRVAVHVAGRLPGFGIVNHVGRRSGRAFRTPVNVYRDGDRYTIALMYGPDSQWVRNVLAAGGCELETRGKRIALTGPERIHDPSQALLPRPVRPLVGRLGVEDFIVLRRG
jgi:deazaflavin-dependent oxidoreductase (nitroreductase family)